MSEFCTLTPYALTMINSMRAMGYSFESALADIVDNSVAAEASRIEIICPTADDAEPYICILDNGHGMSRDKLIESMRYACRNPDNERAKGDLGRFGLGMKTASLSQCRRLTVVSKTSEEVTGTVWDLNVIQKTEDWSLVLLSEEECRRVPRFESLNVFESGTLVVWEDFDRLNLGVDAVHALMDIVSLGAEHLSLIFHRFITGDDDLPEINISVNGTSLQAKDPFGESFRRGASRMPEEFITVKEFPQEPIVVTGYTLPHQNLMSESECRSLGVRDGSRTWGDDQGFYVYRGGRLIYWGGWLRLRQKAQLAKLCRVKVDVPNCMDHLWELDIKKSKATPPRTVREHLSRLLEDLQKKSVVVQRGRRSDRSTDNVGLLWNAELVGKDFYRVSINRENVLVKTLCAAMDTAVRKQFEALLSLLEIGYPSKWVNSQYLADAADINTADASDGGPSRTELKAALKHFLTATGNDGTDDMLLYALQGIPLFEGKMKLTREILNELQQELKNGR